jgi:protein-tyrosine-phosphatase
MAPPTPSESSAGGSLPAALDGPLRAALERGGLVGLPTEAGYVLAAGGEGARDRLAARVPEVAGAPHTWFVSGAQSLVGAALAPLLQRLADRYWPGPLVLAGRAGDGRRAAWQQTSHPLTAALGADFEGRGGLLSGLARDGSGRVLCAAEELRRAWGASLAAVLDDGATRLSEGPGVLRVEPGRFGVEREGLLRLEDLRAAAGLRLRFVCTGNTCRSPMAEALARTALQGRLGTADLASFGFELASAGVHAGLGSPASPHAVTTLAARGIDLRGHGSQPVTRDFLAGTDRIYCLTRGHLEALLDVLPPAQGRLAELLDPAGRDVPDPVGGSAEDYARCAAHLERLVAARLSEWA